MSIEYPEDILKLRKNIKSLKGKSDEEIQDLYGKFSDTEYCAGWMIPADGTVKAFSKWLSKKPKIEVFVTYTLHSDINLLRQTLEAWDDGAHEPIAIQVRAAQADKLRRIAAEAMAKNDYILADLGSKPGAETGVLHVKKGAMKVVECDPRVQ